MRPADTRSEVLHHIVTHGGATVGEISEALAIADATVRRHLDRLEAEGLLDAEPVRHGAGRPSYLYRATAAGVRHDRDRSPQLAARLVTELTREQVRLDRVAEGLADQLVAEHRDQVERKGASLEERIAGTVAALRTEGILDGWAQTSEGYVLHNHACPYLSAASASDCVCESDRRAIEKLIGANVEQVSSVVHGDNTCEYIVTPGTPAGRQEIPIIEIAEQPRSSRPGS